MRTLQTGLTAASWPGDTELPLCILRLPLSEDVLGDCWFAPELEPLPPMSMWMRRSCRSLSGIAARARSSCVCRARVTFWRREEVRCHYHRMCQVASSCTKLQPHAPISMLSRHVCHFLMHMIAWATPLGHATNLLCITPG